MGADARKNQREMESRVCHTRTFFIAPESHEWYAQKF